MCKFFTNRRVTGLAAFSLALLLLAGCGIGLVVGSGNSVTEERPIENVKGVELSFVGDLRITQGNEEKLVITADNNMLPLITTEVNDGILEIGSKSTVGLQPTTELRYDLTVRNLDSLRLSGAGNGEMGGLTTQDLKVEISGAGNLTLNNVQARQVDALLSGFGNLEISGKASRQSVKLSGAGNYSGGDFATGATDVTISGLGNATVRADETLKAVISGAGNIDYYGQPQVSQQITGLGRVHSRDEE